MKIYNKLDSANKVLTILKKQLKDLENDLPIKDVEGELVIQAYRNGRESGYEVSYYRNGIEGAAIFAECRNSDEIVVYPSATHNNVPTNVAFDGRKFYTATPVGFKTAAAFIARKLTQ